jgi:hypothetical protein
MIIAILLSEVTCYELVAAASTAVARSFIACHALASVSVKYFRR